MLTERLRVFSDSAVPVRVRITALAAGVRGCDVVCDVQPAVTSLEIDAAKRAVRARIDGIAPR